MEEYTSNQMDAVQEFAEGLKGCFENKEKTGDEFTKILMNYAMQIIDIHLSLAELKLRRYANNLNYANNLEVKCG